MAKIDFRLVIDQNPHLLFNNLKEHLKKNGFSDIEVFSLVVLEPSKALVTAPIVHVTIKAVDKVYEVKPVVHPNSAGSGPDYLFTKRL